MSLFLYSDCLKMFTLRSNIILLMLFFTVFTPSAEAQEEPVQLSNYALGVAAYQEGEFRRAFDAWSLGAYEGNAEAQYNLGVLYLEGRGVERNIEQAYAWFLKAGDKNQVEAQYNLGHMSLSGMGVKKNVQAALSWWKRAAEGGYAQAQFNYGRALYLGIEGHDDKQGGLLLIRQSAEQKDERALAFLANNAGEIAQLDLAGNAAAVAGDLARVDEPAPRAQPAEAILPASQPSKVKLRVVRDKRSVQQDYLMRSADRPVTIYTDADFRTPIGQLSPGTLLKVMKIEGNKIQVTPAAGLPGWIEAYSLAYSGESAQQLRKAWQAELQTENKAENGPGEPFEVNIASVVEKPVTPEPEDSLALKKIDKTPQPTILATPEAFVGSGKTQADSSKPGINDNVWLFTQDKGAHVIHLFTLINFENALSVSRELPYRDRAHLYTTRVNQQQWTFLLLGPYANETAANNARLALPAHYAKQARVRPISHIAKNRCAKREQLDAQQSEGLDAYCFE